MQEKVTPEMNELLCALVTDVEIENALFMMKPNKSPGPDGFTAGFYIRHWNILKGIYVLPSDNFLKEV